MRERVGHGGVGRRRIGHRGIGGGEIEEAGIERERFGPGEPACAPRPGAWRVGRRPARGPRPVRPGGVVGPVRPAEVPRPTVAPAVGGVDWWDGVPGPRLLVRRPVSARRPGPRYLLRRMVAGIAVIAASAAVVVALGLLTRVAEPAAVAPAGVSVVPAPPAPVVVTAEPGETVWEVADRIAPGSSGPERAALAERIVTENALTSARLHPGQVLRVAAG